MSIKNVIQKHMILSSLGALLLGGGLVAIGSQAVSRSNKAVSVSQTKLSESQVKKIVADYTGAADLVYSKFKLKTSKKYSNSHYEIKAHQNGLTYKFDIDAISGDILSYSTDNKDKIHSQSRPKSSSSDQPVESSQSSTNLISQDKVKEIAAKETGKNDLNFAYIKLEMDDGRQIYDVKATSGDKKYDLDIDAQSGQLISFEEENIIQKPAGTPATTAKISEEEVKKIVQETTGQSNLSYTKIKLSRDDDYAGRLIYEVTAYAAGVEYELDIDADSGQVLSSSAERDGDD